MTFLSGFKDEDHLLTVRGEPVRQDRLSRARSDDDITEGAFFIHAERYRRAGPLPDWENSGVRAILRRGQHHARRFFADHDRGCIGVPRSQRRHDRSVRDP